MSKVRMKVATDEMKWLVAGFGVKWVFRVARATINLHVKLQWWEYLKSSYSSIRQDIKFMKSWRAGASIRDR
jgi:hypothetical protein